MVTRRTAATLVFIAGLLIMILGITFLFGFMEGISRITVFFALLLVSSGAFCAVLAIRLNKRSFYLFFASLFIMTGIFILLLALGIIPLPISRSWPLLSVFSGLALLPVGWRRCGGFSTRYFVSSCAFVALGCVLMFFSLRVLPFSFKRFILDWWPLLFILCGVTLVLTSLVSRNLPGKDPDETDADEDSSNPEHK